MADDVNGLSDKALSIFVFAAYHRLVSGEKVTAVIRRDGAGHEADPEGVKELEGRGLVTAGETDIDLGETAQAAVETMVAALRREVGR
ncbi:hypothetical protein ABC766_01415 [Methylobacterium fujisawaense]|uniref:hypothetical protein n=1 Tax=Methylobacterium fujisawaense TaxID=107400 RepID=UPI0031F59BF5